MSKKIATSLDLSSNCIHNLGIGTEASDAVNKSQLDQKVTANSSITGSTNTKITYDSKGLVTSGTNLSASDIPNININQVNTLQTVLDSKLDNISLIGEYTQLKPVFGSGQTSKLTASASNNSTAQGWTKLYSWSPLTYSKRHMMLHAASGGRGTLSGIVNISFMQEASATTIASANISTQDISGAISNFSLIFNTTSSMIELWYNDTNAGNQQTVFSPIKITGQTPTAYYGVSQASLPAYSIKFDSIDLHVDYLEGLTGNIQTQIDSCFNDDPFDIQPTTDLNSIVNSGSYRIFSSVAFSATYNQPVGAYTYGQLRVFVGRAGQVYQEYHPDRSVNTNGRTVYRRNKYATSNEWSSWVRDVTTDDLNAKQPLDSTLTALADLSSGIPLLTSDSAATTINRATLAESLRSNSAISGGGTISVNSTFYVKWSNRFIIITNGKGSHFSTTGYFDIGMPSSGTVITGLGTPNKTVDANGILLGAWDALYYILPIGVNEPTVNANFRLVNYQYVTEIPETWVLLALRNNDTGFVQFPNGVCLYAGESRTDHWQKQINSKQDALTIDTTVIDGSTNPVTSNGVYDALTDKVSKSVTSDQSISSPLVTKKSIYNHRTSGTSGTIGHFKICTITITNNYTNRPLEFTITQRSKLDSAKVSLLFNNESGLNPGISAFTYNSLSTYGIYAYRTATSIWEIYVTKTESYDNLEVSEFHDAYGQFPNIVWETSQVSTVPSGSIQATLATLINATNGNAATATKLATARNIALTGNVSGSANFDGSANISITATVEDYSHKHNISNVDGLQNDLNFRVLNNTIGYNVASLGYYWCNMGSIYLETGKHNSMLLDYHGSFYDNQHWSYGLIFVQLNTASTYPTIKLTKINTNSTATSLVSLYGDWNATTSMLTLWGAFGGGNSGGTIQCNLLSRTINTASFSPNGSWQSATPTWTNQITATKQELTNVAPTSHASTATTYGVPSTSNYGHAMASSATPTMNGTASAGTNATKFAQEGHVHPNDTSRLALGSGMAQGANMQFRAYSSSNTYSSGIVYLEY